MSIRKLVLWSTLGAMLALESCEPQSTATDPANQPQANLPGTGLLAFRLPADFVKNQLADGYTVQLSVYGSKMDRPIYQEFPADTNDIFIPNLRTGTVYVSLALVNYQTQLNYYANDTVRINPFVLNRLSLTLKPRNDLFPVGALQVVVNVDTTHREDSAVYIKCQTPGPNNYCYDAGLTDSAVVGPWNCSAWNMVGGKRTCQTWLPVVDAPTTDGYCAKRIEGSPMVCTQARDKYDPYYVPVSYPISSYTIPVK